METNSQQQLLLHGPRIHLLRLLAVLTAVRQTRFTARRLAQHHRARASEHDRLRVTEHRRDIETARTLDVHEVRVRGLSEATKLVLGRFFSGRWVQKITGLVTEQTQRPNKP